MKLFFAVFTIAAIFVLGIGAIAAMDISPEQKLVRRVVDHNNVN